MKIAVTGANGFVGRHVVADLARRKDVTVVASSRSPVPSATLPANVQYLQIDMASPPADAYVALGNPDALVHLAWAGLPNYRSLHHFESELPRQYMFLRNLVEAGLPAMLVAGTCYEYGMASGELCEERVSMPVNPYGYAKAALLEQLQYLRKEKNFALTWARLFYMYGEGQAPTSLYPLLRAAVARGDVCFPMSSGEQLRDYLPVTDIARMMADMTMRRSNAGPVNICSGTPISVRQLVENFIKSHNWSIALDRGRYPIPDYEPLAFWGSVKKLNALLSPP
jgi:dTDP-6-deoxy-L-talose 4-dehydrogenase (NAD+)